MHKGTDYGSTVFRCESNHTALAGTFCMRHTASSFTTLPACWAHMPRDAVCLPAPSPFTAPRAAQTAFALSFRRLQPFCIRPGLACVPPPPGCIFPIKSLSSLCPEMYAFPCAWLLRDSRATLTPSPQERGLTDLRVPSSPGSIRGFSTGSGI